MVYVTIGDKEDGTEIPICADKVWNGDGKIVVDTIATPGGDPGRKRIYREEFDADRYTINKIRS